MHTGRKRKAAPSGRLRNSLQIGYGASRTRTGDLLGAIQALSQLSYSPAPGQSSGDGSDFSASQGFRYSRLVEAATRLDDLVEQMRATLEVTGELTPEALDPETEQALLTTFRSWWNA